MSVRWLTSGLLLFGLALLWLTPRGSAQSAASQSDAAATTAFKKAQPLIKKYCEGCHAGASASAKLNFAAWKDLSAARKEKAKAEKALKFLRGQTMPPPGIAQPTQPERLTLERGMLAVYDPSKLTQRPTVTIRRLNREEYDNTIQDLLGIQFAPGRDFPNDDVGYGFDTIGDVLSVSPLLVEKYLDAAEKASQLAIWVPGSTGLKFDAGQMKTDTGRTGETSMVLFMNGKAIVDADVASAGKYRIKVTAYAQQAGPEAAKMTVALDGKSLGTVEVRGTDATPSIVEFPVDLGKGAIQITAAFINDFYDPNHPDRSKRDRNLYVQFIELVGPLGSPNSLPASHARIFVVRPDPANPGPGLTTIFEKFMLRAYRRPPTAKEVQRVVALASTVIAGGEPVERGVQVGVQAVLTSPHFLLRVEPNRAPGTPLNDYEMATRLSYFLWSTMPDDVLLDLASKKKLSDPKVLKEQTTRMLLSPKSVALTSNFASQWLQLRKFDNLNPDAELFPEFTAELRRDMREETETYFQFVLRENRPAFEIIDSTYSFLNERLAKHYGIAGVTGPKLRKVELGTQKRGGILTQGSILTVTSNPNRTSPVKRGKYVLEQILGAAPPPPPPGVDSLEDDQKAFSSKSIKDRMARHRKDPNCAVCHIKMDSIGYAFENFDAVGKWRDKDGDLPIDPAGEIPGETKFANAIELRSYLLGQKVTFVRALADRLLIYGLGRGTTEFDTATVNKVVNATANDGFRLQTLVHGIVQSETFRQY